MKKQLFFTFCLSLILLVQGCNLLGKKDAVTPDLIQPSDAKSLGAAIILPDGTKTEQGTPPAPSTSPQAPKVNTTETDKSTTNGSVENISFQYSNLNGGIGGAYSQIEGSPNYYVIPIQNSGSSRTGTISLPIGLPENLASGTFIIAVCIYDASGRVSNIIRVRITITRFETPKTGEGTAVINGQTSSAEAICDMDLGFGIKGFAILLNGTSTTATKGVVLYNLKQGSNQLVDLLNDYFDNGNYDIDFLSTKPWAYYVDGEKIYSAVSGTATYSGNTVKVSGRFVGVDFLDTSGSINISATGKCK